VPPMTASLMGRFFAVPLLIIGTIVGGAVLVVVLFGGPVTSQERSVDELLRALEAGSGEKSFGVLLPREKELWQTALELSVRLQKQGTGGGLTDEELETAAERIGAMVEADLANVGRVVTVGEREEDHRRVRSARLQFLIHALGRTRRPMVIDRLIALVRDAREPYARAAMHELGNLHEMAGSRRAIAAVLTRLDAAMKPATRLMACHALSVLASPGDATVIAKLTQTHHTAEGEVAWSAALALGRLESNAGKSTLLDLLDREHLESGKRFEATDDDGNTIQRYALPPQRVEATLLAAIDAASNLRDADLWETIERLKSDRSPVVRNRAGERLAARASDGAGDP
ncbi:MAG: HEAT repeat domain-containing protein, partial [Phycisphaerae bacterium]